MDIPEYVSIDEVKRVCTALNLHDWTTLQDPHIKTEEAQVILQAVNTDGMNIDLEDFCKGLEVELEHGLRFKEANVTNNHPILTGKIVLAHLKESVDYYKRLEVAELEGDLLKAIKANDPVKTETLFKKLNKAKLALEQAESKQLVEV